MAPQVKCLATGSMSQVKALQGLQGTVLLLSTKAVPCGEAVAGAAVMMMVSRVVTANNIRSGLQTITVIQNSNHDKLHAGL